MKLKEFMYLLYYSIRSFIDDAVDMLSELKNPKAWSYILLSTFALCLYYQRYVLVWWLIPLFFIVKVIRDEKDSKYRKEMYENDIRKDKDTDIVFDHYERYKKDCKYSHKVSLEYGEWKEGEVKRIQK